MCWKLGAASSIGADNNEKNPPMNVIIILDKYQVSRVRPIILVVSSIQYLAKPPLRPRYICLSPIPRPAHPHPPKSYDALYPSQIIVTVLSCTIIIIHYYIEIYEGPLETLILFMSLYYVSYFSQRIPLLLIDSDGFWLILIVVTRECHQRMTLERKLHLSSLGRAHVNFKFLSQIYQEAFPSENMQEQV